MSLLKSKLICYNYINNTYKITLIKQQYNNESRIYITNISYNYDTSYDSFTNIFLMLYRTINSWFLCIYIHDW